MKGFIEVTISYDNHRLILPVSGIKSVIENDDGRVLLEFESICCTDKPRDKISVIDIAETYVQIKQNYSRQCNDETKTEIKEI